MDGRVAARLAGLHDHHQRKARRLFARKRTRTVVITMRPDGGKPISVRRKITFRKRR